MSKMRPHGESKAKNQEDVKEMTLSLTDLGLLKETNEYLSTNLENHHVEERREQFRVYDSDEITEATTTTTEMGSTGTNRRTMLLLLENRKRGSGRRIEDPNKDKKTKVQAQGRRNAGATRDSDEGRYKTETWQMKGQLSTLYSNLTCTK